MKESFKMDRIRAVVDGVDEVATSMERKWGVDRHGSLLVMDKEKSVSAFSDSKKCGQVIARADQISIS